MTPFWLRVYNPEYILGLILWYWIHFHLIHGWTDGWMNGSSHPASINHWIEESTNHWIGAAINHWIDELLNHWINKSVNRWIALLQEGRHEHLGTAQNQLQICNSKRRSPKGRGGGACRRQLDNSTSSIVYPAPANKFDYKIYTSVLQDLCELTSSMQALHRDRNYGLPCGVHWVRGLVRPRPVWPSAWERLSFAQTEQFANKDHQ